MLMPLVITLKSRNDVRIYKANPPGVCPNTAFFCYMASEKPWCFLEHFITVLSNRMITFPDIDAKIASGHMKDWDAGFRYTICVSPKLLLQ